MLIDLIDPDKLPYWLVWLDWCFYAYRLSFIVIMMVAFLIWIIYCFSKQGIAVG